MRYRVGDFVLDLRKFELRKDERVLQAEPQVLSLLFLLVENRDRLVSKDELVATIWDGRAISDSAISSRVKSARHLLDDDGQAQRLIRTVHGKGFRFVGEVSPCGDESWDAGSANGASRSGKAAGEVRRRILIVAAAAAVLVIGLIVSHPWHHVKLVSLAVLPAAATPESRDLARDLTAKLGMLDSSSETSVRLLDKVGAADPDLMFQVDASSQADSVETNLVLLNGKRELIWSRDFRRPKVQLADLKQQLAFSADTVLRCALEAESDNDSALDRRTLKTFLNACADYSQASEETVRDLSGRFERVTRAAPAFQPAWKRRLLTDSELVRDFNWEERQADSDRLRLESDLAGARRINPDMPEIFLARAVMVPASAYAVRMRLADEAVARGPDDAELLRFRTRFLMQVGRMAEAIDDARKAVRLDPLSPATREELVVALACAGRTAAAIEELRKAEQLWPGAASILEARYLLYLRFDDPKEAIRLRNSGLLNISGAPLHGAFLEARASPSPANVEKALHDARSIFAQNPMAVADLAQVLAAFGREDELFALLLQRPPPYDLDDLLEVIFRPAFRTFHHDPRMMQVAARFGLLGYWRSSGKWPDFCFDPDLPYDCKRPQTWTSAPARTATLKTPQRAWN